MSKHHRKPGPPSTPKPLAKKAEEKKPKRKIILPSPYIVMFVVVWVWAALWYGDTLHIAREFSFWSWDSTLMYYEKGRPWGELWQIGLLLLQLYRWPAIGALLLSLLLTGGTYLFGYCLRLRSWWQLLQYIPALLYMSYTAYVGFDLYFESEAGRIMGIPFLCFLVLLIIALIIRSFSKHHRLPPIFRSLAGENWKLGTAYLVAVVLAVAVPMLISQLLRPYVRVTTKMQCCMERQDWAKMAQTGRDHADMSYRPIAAYYAIALVQSGEIATHLFDIRMDFDDVYIHEFGGTLCNVGDYYMADCDFHAGLVETSIHHAMENLTMNGPNLRALKLLTKCALLNGEWEVAEKYFAILHRVPFEGKWLAKYEPMLRDSAAVNRDPEFHMVRLTEPVHDNFENNFEQPAFLGYNAALLEGRSINALWNCLAVHLYSKSMPQFIYRCYPMQGTTPPGSFAEALALMSSKQPELMQNFVGLEWQRERLAKFAKEVKPYMKDRAKYARELFPKYKGYYPYYYFFGNLKATKRQEEARKSSSSGVN